MKSFREAKWFDIALWAFGFVLLMLIVLGIVGECNDRFNPPPEKFTPDTVRSEMAADSNPIINEEEAFDSTIPPGLLADPNEVHTPDSGTTEKKGATS